MHVLQSYPPWILSSCEAFAATELQFLEHSSCQESGFAIPRVSDASLPSENKHVAKYKHNKGANWTILHYMLH